MQDDFFIVLRNMLESRPEVSEIHCVKDAKVPLMRFKFDGISVDLPYAQLRLLYIPEVSVKTMKQSLGETTLSVTVSVFLLHKNYVDMWDLKVFFPIMTSSLYIHL